LTTRRAITTSLLLAVFAAAPALADESPHRQRSPERRESYSAGRDQRGDGARAVPRSPDAVRRADAARVQGDYAPPRNQTARYEARQIDSRPEGVQRYDSRSYAVPRPYYDQQRAYYSNRYYYPSTRYYYGPRPVIVPRVVYPRVVTVVPYQPYYYRPRFGPSIYYGAGGAYPYGYTPPGYYAPVAGGVYGGVRIVAASPDAQVFADGYYVGIADDFDAPFEHMNLEAGVHRIEVREPGYGAIAFDVSVQPGRTITLRVNPY